MAKKYKIFEYNEDYDFTLRYTFKGNLTMKVLKGFASEVTKDDALSYSIRDNKGRRVANIHAVGIQGVIDVFKGQKHLVAGRYVCDWDLYLESKRRRERRQRITKKGERL